jgi:hypothetical protein
MTLVSEIVRLGCGAAGTLLTPSTPFAYPQVVSRSFALFRVVSSAFPQVTFVSITGSIPGSSTREGPQRCGPFLVHHTWPTFNLRMDRIWQWAWDRYAARYSWAMYAVGFPLLLQIYLVPSFLIVAYEESRHYVEAAAVTVVAVLVLQYVMVFPAGRNRGFCPSTSGQCLAHRGHLHPRWPGPR